MNILIVGKGGREHALAYKFSTDDRVRKVFVYPGNPGMLKTGKVEIIDFENTQALKKFYHENEIVFILIGPEDLIANGFSDELRSMGLNVFAPTQKAGQLESSKIFAKSLMDEFGIPTAKSNQCYSYEEAIKALESFSQRVVIKLSGLHAGKGVYVSEGLSDAQEKLREWKHFLADGVVLEEFLEGYEVSFFYMCKNDSAIFLGEASDHKRIFDDNKGDNTGGMGCFSPNPKVTDKMRGEITERFAEKTLKAMIHRGIPFEGILFLGIMVTNDGPKLLEYNVRFGDPETQTLMPRIETGFLDAFLKFFGENQFSNHAFTFSKKASVHVVKSAAGYPQSPKVGDTINIDQRIDPLYFFAGVKNSEDMLVTAGGRVCGLTSLGETIEEARNFCYQHLHQVRFNGEHFRKDIAKMAEGKATH